MGPNFIRLYRGAQERDIGLRSTRAARAGAGGRHCSRPEGRAHPVARRRRVELERRHARRCSGAPRHFPRWQGKPRARRWSRRRNTTTASSTRPAVCHRWSLPRTRCRAARRRAGKQRRNAGCLSLLWCGRCGSPAGGAALFFFFFLPAYTRCRASRPDRLSRAHRHQRDRAQGRSTTRRGRWLAQNKPHDARAATVAATLGRRLLLRTGCFRTRFQEQPELKGGFILTLDKVV
mmetsp:Transcript_15943/g.64299  ORF Transcript_15943/g.64299 Transcript_15943/m.64299 type:complete len:234 (+) Transcript_15943:1938-2639(+)